MEVNGRMIFTTAEKSRLHEIELLSREKIKPGGHLGKEYWTANLVTKGKNGEERKREIHLVKRILQYEPGIVENQTNSDYFITIWREMKSSGLPVPPTVVKINDNEILETNLKWDASEIYGKDSKFDDYPPSPLDHLFLKVDIDLVMKQAEEVVQIAEGNNIKLSKDHAFDLLLHPNGTWNVVTRDIKNAVIKCNPNAEIKKFHIERLFRFRRALELTKKRLSEPKIKIN